MHRFIRALKSLPQRRRGDWVLAVASIALLVPYEYLLYLLRRVRPHLEEDPQYFDIFAAFVLPPILAALCCLVISGSRIVRRGLTSPMRSVWLMLLLVAWIGWAPAYACTVVLPNPPAMVPVR